jgi:hypothetical protein
MKLLYLTGYRNSTTYVHGSLKPTTADVTLSTKLDNWSEQSIGNDCDLFMSHYNSYILKTLIEVRML